MATNTSKKQSGESAKPPVAKLRNGLAINAEACWEPVRSSTEERPPSSGVHSVTFEAALPYRTTVKKALDAQLTKYDDPTFAHPSRTCSPTMASHGDQPSPLMWNRPKQKAE